MSKRKSGNSLGCFGEIFFVVFALIMAIAIAHPIAFVLVLIIVVFFLISWQHGNEYDNHDPLPMFKEPPKRYVDTPKYYAGHGNSSYVSGCEIISSVRDSSGRTRRFNVDSSYYHPTPHCDAVREKWRSVTNQHWELSRSIRESYSSILSKKKESYFTPKMESIIGLCQQDISLAEQFKKYEEELYLAECVDGVYKSQPPPCLKEYPSFYRLAAIYDRRREYESAIAVCDYAIELGYIDEESGKTMYDRRDRMYKKLGIPPPDLNADDFDPFPEITNSPPPPAG